MTTDPDDIRVPLIVLAIAVVFHVAVKALAWLACRSLDRHRVGDDRAIREWLREVRRGEEKRL